MKKWASVFSAFAEILLWSQGGVDSDAPDDRWGAALPEGDIAMNILNLYEHILTQALAEIGPIEVQHDNEKALALQGELAPRLGDILFRLTIEFGVPFAPFRETLISIFSGEKTAEVTPAGESTPRPFGSTLENSHALILLALEIMPAESFDRL